MSANTKLILILRTVFCDSSMLVTTSSRSFCTQSDQLEPPRHDNQSPTPEWPTRIRTMSAASMATSVPVPMAMPTSARARAGESLTPSPTMATRSPLSCSSWTLATLWDGSTSANTFVIPT